MSQGPRGPGFLHDEKVQPGSVKVIRQRMEAGMILEPPPRSPSRPAGLPLPRPPTFQPPIESTHDGCQAHGGTASVQEISVPIISKPPPRRPQRPSYVSSILDASNTQERAPTLQSVLPQPVQSYPNQKYWETNYESSPIEPSTPGTGLSGTSNSSRQSTTSSYGSIPDFPVPAIPTTQQSQHQTQNLAPLQSQARRSIGPPPSARRGASSYYSHSSYVAPIPEETSESPVNIKKAHGEPHGSYASSHVIPRNWRDSHHEYADREAYGDDEERDDGRSSRGSDIDESSTLVRKASLGKQLKPTLTTVRSSGASEIDDSGSGPAANTPKATVRVTSQIHAESNEASLWKKAHGEQGLTSTSDPSKQPPSPTYQLVSPLEEKDSDTRIRQIIGGLERGGAISPGTTSPSAIPRRPLRIDVNAVHQAEARGSLTSLTDLIRRATRVRHNLDSGKTASRLGMLDFGNTGNSNVSAEKKCFVSQNQKRNSDSLSGMIDSFPAPNLTPRSEREGSHWPSPYVGSNTNLDPVRANKQKPRLPKKQGRRCCGLPLWAFVMLLILLLLLAAAAVVIPVALIVIPQAQNQYNHVGTLSKCAEINKCQNSGQPVVSRDSCRCVCIGGFTGSDCSQEQSVDCTVANVDGFTGATMGNSIPALLEASSSKFSIPLNATDLLSTFAANNLSCRSELALISFNERTERRSMPLVGDFIPPSPPLSAVIIPSLAARYPQQPAISAVTSNGVLLDPAATDGTVPTALIVDGNAPTPTSPGISSTSVNQPEQSDFDFAGVAVLWILQQTQDLTISVEAQQALKRHLGNNFIAETVDITDNVNVDFLDQKVTANGTTVGGISF